MGCGFRFFRGEEPKFAEANRRRTIRAYLIDAHESEDASQQKNAPKGRLSIASATLLHSLQSCIRKGLPFEDDDFPADASSLNPQTGSNWGEIVWVRPKDTFAGPSPILFDEPSPDDVRQGALGDCYFLSSLSVLAERPELIRFLFECGDLGPLNQKAMANLGCYRMKVCIGGQWRSVAVDDRFPCRNKDSPVPVFSSCQDSNELWVLVAEKAWAKLHTSYHRFGACSSRINRSSALVLQNRVW